MVMQQHSDTALPASNPKRKTLYFAYGSNLHLGQMARRCPKSRFIGRATLRNFRWQINERRYANVVADKGSSVEGLVYELDGTDESRLDVNEGVANGAYIKAYLPVTVYRAVGSLHRCLTRLIVNYSGPETDSQTDVSEGKEKHTEEEQYKCYVQLDVLVYASDTYVTEGKPWNEYIDRMNLAIKDAVALGADPSFFNNVVRKYIPDRT